MEQANSIDAYLKILKQYENGSELYYRGQLEKYPDMPPTIARHPGYAENENEIYQEAISLGSIDLEGLTTPLERLSKLQHYGIPTRLVDVTINPLIALYFAVENVDVDNESHGNVYLYQVQGYPIDSKEIRVLSLLPTIKDLSIDNIAKEYRKQFGDSISGEDILSIVNTPVILQHSAFLQKSNQRLYNQKGTFLLCGNEVCDGLITNHLKSLDTYTPTLVIRIPFEYKRAIKEELDNICNINITTIYPELPSVAQYIKEKYKKENTSLDGTYSIVKKEDISTCVAKRISIIIVLNKQLAIEEIKEISIHVMQRYQEHQNVIWLYVARTGDDYITCNWILRAQWIDPKLNPTFRPSTIGIKENGYYWDCDKSYSILADFNEQEIFEDDSALYSKYKKIWVQFLVIFKRLLNAFTDYPWNVFVKEILNAKKQLTNLFIQLSDFGHSHNKEFDDFLGKIYKIVGLVHEVCLLIDNNRTNGDVDRVKRYTQKRFDEVKIQIEQINHGFSEKWKFLF